MTKCMAKSLAEALDISSGDASAKFDLLLKAGKETIKGTIECGPATLFKMKDDSVLIISRDKAGILMDVIEPEEITPFEIGFYVGGQNEAPKETPDNPTDSLLRGKCQYIAGCLEVCLVESEAQKTVSIKNAIDFLKKI